MEARTTILNGVSKTFAMTGWRVGYAIAPATVAMRMARVPISSSSMVATFAQIAGIEALTGSWTQINNLIGEYQNRAQYFSKRLNEIKGITCLMPEATFYIFPSIKELGLSSEKFTTGLLNYKVKVSNGIQFGESGEGHVRMSLCKPIETLEESANRIEKFVKSL
jgi:aspartate/methionine/tyrosine aminotransferase